ncbi:MAG: DUF6261 family protein [Paludibacter sp.]
MIEIMDAPLTRCSKKQHAWLMSAVSQTLEKYPTVKIEVANLYQPFSSALAVENVALEYESGSLTTAKLDKKDEEREDFISGFTHLIETGRRHFDPVKVEAAEYLYRIVKKFGNFTRKPNKDETVDIRTLCNELLSAEAAPYMAALPETSDWVSRIQTTNEEYDILYLVRNAENGGSVQVTSLQARINTDPCYKAIIRRINALTELNGAEKYQALIGEINSLIGDMKQTKEAEATTRRKQNEKKAADGEVK